ncbi:Pfs NB-ARC and Ankyrin domain protein [Pyrenophora tritici-repentis]|nr:Pfs NB-ARC and Ankyrin domain protein [Pyrenophora tritici-repentis]
MSKALLLLLPDYDQSLRMPPRLRREDYTVGWICALPIELAAAMAMLDEEHEDAPRQVGDNDENIYSVGSVAGHNVVIGCLPAGQIGTNSATAVVTQMRAAFKAIRFGLMVGIGGGVPSVEADIRLGDVVVSQPQQNFGGVVQYDLGKATPHGFERFGALNSPPRILLSALSKIQAKEWSGKSTLSKHIYILESNPTFCRSRAGPDLLFRAAYNHERGPRCDQCSVENLEPRLERKSQAEVKVHYGTIASGNKVIKDAVERDKVSRWLGGVLCFEMEAAGLMNSFPCLVIRGICDYADTHKNYQWQAYGAGTAAAYAKELLSVIPATDVAASRTVEEAIKDATNGGSKRRLQSSSPHRAPHKRKRIENLSSPESDFGEQRAITPSIHSQEPSQTPLNGEQRQNLLDSLRFSQVDARQMTIKTAHAKTCRWLLKSEQYLSWLDKTKVGKHHGFLWIKGKAGTGKSTLMKFALVNAPKTMKDYIVLSFFFNARGGDMERSTIGTYRSLLLQLLERLPVLQSVFDSLSLSSSSFSADHQWNVESLKTLLEQAIWALGNSSVVCLIDALDECEEDQVRDMVQFFEHIGDLVVSNGIRFQVCFSSRHYPHITIRNGLELVLEGQEGHSQDITNYVETELKIGKSKTAQRVRAELQEKASGIFMWVVLVVGILNKESDRGQVLTLQRKLREIPGDLHELFRDILTRDTHNKEGLVLCIQWILFAKQPLSPEQLYHAILSGVDLEVVAEWDPEEITKDVVKRFILDSSKGLAEVTASKEQRVQFIHESVRDFLLKENGLGKIWPEFGSNFQGQSHERLKQCCLNYISVDVATPLKIPNDPLKAFSQQAASLRKSATETFPFLEYATRSVLYHADAAEGGGISQAGFLDSFPLPRWVKLDILFEKHEVRRHTERVSLLYLLSELNAANLIRIHPSISSCLDEENERYGCAFFAANAMGNQEAMQACIGGLVISPSVFEYSKSCPEKDSIKERVEGSLGRDFKYSKKVGILIYAVETGSAAVLAYLIGSKTIELDTKDARRRTPLYVAVDKGSSVLTRMLLDNGADANAQDGDYRNALQAASERGHTEIVKLLLDKGADVNAQGGGYGNALQAASERGHKGIVKLLLDKGADVNAQDGFGLHSNALQAALAIGHTEIVKLLLDKGADVNAQGGGYGNALQAASERGHKGVVKLLLDKGADVNAQDGFGLHGNALQASSEGGHTEVVKLLLDNGADVNAQGGDYRNALQVASERGHKEVVELLLDNGADVNAQGGDYRNALQAASEGGHTEVVELLLDNGADVNAQDGFGLHGNALQAASERGHTEVVKLLLDNGADVNAQGGLHSNALQAALERGHKEVVKLLLDKGADVNAQGGLHGNALQAASERGHTEVVKLLLDNGADVNAQGGDYGNALQAASERGHKEVVELLLDNGADVNAQGGDYRNALQAASEGGHTEVVELLLDKGADVNAQEVVKLLLDKGADVNAQGGLHGNALQAASERGHTEVVKLLLDKGADIALSDENGFTPINAASSNGHSAVARLLLERGACIVAHGADRHYDTIMNLFAFWGHLDLLRLAHEQSHADVHLPQIHGRTPLHLAARGGHMDTFQYLISLGLDPTTMDVKGDDVLCYASSGGSLDIVNAILGRSPKRLRESTQWDPLHWACRAGNVEVVRLLIEEGFCSRSVTILESEGQWSPLAIALFHGNDEMLEHLSSSFRSRLGIEANTVLLRA